MISSRCSVRDLLLFFWPIWMYLIAYIGVSLWFILGGIAWALLTFNFWGGLMIILLLSGIFGYYIFQVVKKLYKRAKLSYWQILVIYLLDFLLYPFMIFALGPFAFFQIAPPLYFELAWLGRFLELILWMIVLIYFMKKVPLNLTVRCLIFDVWVISSFSVAYLFLIIIPFLLKLSMAECFHECINLVSILVLSISWANQKKINTGQG